MNKDDMLWCVKIIWHKYKSHNSKDDKKIIDFIRREIITSNSQSNKVILLEFLDTFGDENIIKIINKYDKKRLFATDFLCELFIEKFGRIMGMDGEEND